MKDSEKTALIYKALHKKYFKPSRFVVPNIYFYPEPYTETDFLVVNKNNHTYDIEVKVSRADFKNDFKKTDKHEIIQTGKYTLKHLKAVKNYNTGRYDHIPKGTVMEAEIRPSRFYYCTPTGLVTVDEIPEYAGLLEVDLKSKKIKEIKPAPLLCRAPMKEQIDEILVTKFYYRMQC